MERSIRAFGKSCARGDDPAPPPELAEVLAAFPGATVAVRPPTPVPAPPVPGSWRVWSRPLPPKRWRMRRRRAFWSEERPADGEGGGAGRYGEDWPDLGPNPNGCIHCGEHCDSRILNDGRLPDGRWEHLECALKQGDER